jgi:hypothetical protein
MKEYRKMSLKKGVLALCTASPLAGAAFAQTPPPPPGADAPPAASGSAPVYDPGQLPAFKGSVEQFTLTPRGDIDGFILADGTEVKTPPHLSTEIAATLRKGDAVTIHGLKAAAMPLIQATAVTNNSSGQTVVDNGPPPKGPKGRHGPHRGPGQATVQGRVRTTLHGPRGDVNGALLEDDTVLRLPPPEAARFAALLAPGQSVTVQGREAGSVLGRVIEATAIGQSSARLSKVKAPPPPPPPGGPEPRH